MIVSSSSNLLKTATVISEQPGLISQWMQEVEGQFAQVYNRRKKRSGSFWEGRYHRTMIAGTTPVAVHGLYRAES